MIELRTSCCVYDIGDTGSASDTRIADDMAVTVTSASTSISSDSIVYDSSSSSDDTVIAVAVTSASISSGVYTAVGEIYQH